MSSLRRERIRRAGRARFILLYGVCGFGLLFGSAMALLFGLPAFFVVRLLHGHFEPFSVWWCFVLPVALGMVAGFQWGGRMWEALFTSSSHPST